MLLRSLPLLRLRLHVHRQRLAVGLIAPSRRPWCTSSAAESTRPDEKLSSADDTTAFLRVNDSPKFPRWDDPDYRRWKDKEEEILNDIEPIVSLTKEILHSGRSVSLFVIVPNIFIYLFFQIIWYLIFSNYSCCIVLSTRNINFQLFGVFQLDIGFGYSLFLEVLWRR